MTQLVLNGYTMRMKNVAVLQIRYLTKVKKIDALLVYSLIYYTPFGKWKLLLKRFLFG